MASSSAAQAHGAGDAEIADLAPATDLGRADVADAGLVGRDGWVDVLDHAVSI